MFAHVLLGQQNRTKSSLLLLATHALPMTAVCVAQSTENVHLYTSGMCLSRKHTAVN